MILYKQQCLVCLHFSWLRPHIEHSEQRLRKRPFLPFLLLLVMLGRVPIGAEVGSLIDAILPFLRAMVAPGLVILVVIS